MPQRIVRAAREHLQAAVRIEPRRDRWMAPPRENQPDHGPACGAVCQMCHSALSVPRANTSMRPSELTTAAGSVVMPPPKDAHPDQGPACGAVCQMCHSAPSVPRAKASSRPSELHTTAGSLVMMPPRKPSRTRAPRGRRLPVVPQCVVGAAGEQFQPPVGVVDSHRIAGDDASQ